MSDPSTDIVWEFKMHGNFEIWISASNTIRFILGQSYISSLVLVFSLKTFEIISRVFIEN